MIAILFIIFKIIAFALLGGSILLGFCMETNSKKEEIIKWVYLTILFLGACGVLYVTLIM